MYLFTTCVNYADYLAVTLPAWSRLGNVVVITAEHDKATQQLCLQHVNVACVRTSGWFRDGAVLNKGGAQDDVIKRIAKPGQQIVLFDADCYPVCGAAVFPTPPDPHHIVSCRRFNAENQRELEEALRRSPRHTLPELKDSSYRPELCRGYFQTFLYRDTLSFGRKRDRTFSGCDLWLASQFTHNRWVDPGVFQVIHLGENRVNWKGRVTPPWQ